MHYSLDLLFIIIILIIQLRKIKHLHSLLTRFSLLKFTNQNCALKNAPLLKYGIIFSLLQIWILQSFDLFNFSTTEQVGYNKLINRLAPLLSIAVRHDATCVIFYHCTCQKFRKHHIFIDSVLQRTGIIIITVFDHRLQLLAILVCAIFTPLITHQLNYVGNKEMSYWIFCVHIIQLV